jgi:hypothetical protein
MTSSAREHRLGNLVRAFYVEPVGCVSDRVDATAVRDQPFGIALVDVP